MILVCGGADDLRGERMAVAEGLLGPAVTSAAERTGAAVVDGGTASGVMALMGAARWDRPDAVPILLGVAPSGMVTYPGADTGDRPSLEPHHTHFVLAESNEWGGETRLMMEVSEALADSAPVVVVIAGGGAVAGAEALEAAARGWPLFVIEGTGGTADEIAAALPTRRARRRRADALLGDGIRKIVTDGDVRPFAGSEPVQLARRLAWELQDEPLLKDAWRTFATYDGLAAGLRTTFGRFQASILVLGILATLLALLDNAIGAPALHWTVVAAPILVSVVIALANRRAAGKRWVLLRAAAESIKGEIYRYRTRTGPYADRRLPDADPATRPRRLAAQIDAIEAGLMHTEASSGRLTPYDGALPPEMYGAGRDDDGLSPLDPSRYLQIRIGDQLRYYHHCISQLDRRRTTFQLLAVAAGGSGAILAAAGVEVWIGLTTAISGAALSYLAYLQVDNTIVAYNQAASTLTRLEREWAAGDHSTDDPAAVEDLVTRGEAVLTTELGGWVQQMTAAMDRLHAQQADAPRRVQPAEDRQPR
ncbi:MAG TPA: DUF4231 domain-containing protein [Solirubrobacteraceae bacterium]|nr:DUF4231 domain-containing protein [Solirubrobacteraceae bacterium]